MQKDPYLKLKTLTWSAACMADVRTLQFRRPIYSNSCRQPLITGDEAIRSCMHVIDRRLPSYETTPGYLVRKIAA
jgi:hypothetical protein